MQSFLVKRSAFSFYGYGDAIAEKDFIGNDFSLEVTDETAVFCLKLSALEDAKVIKERLKDFDTLVFDEAFVVNKLQKILPELSGIRYYKLKITGYLDLSVPVTKIMVQQSKIVLHHYA